MKILASAPGKIVIFGEYAVVDGGRAIVGAIQPRLRISVHIQSSQFSVLHAHQVGPSDIHFSLNSDHHLEWKSPLSALQRKELELVRVVLERAHRYLAEREMKLPAVHIEIDAKHFWKKPFGQKLGTGSSAALVVALWGALLRLMGCETANLAHIFHLAHQTQQFVQGRFGSGVDIAAATFGNVRIYQRCINPRDFIRPSQLALPDWFQPVLIWSGKSYSTSRILARMQALEKHKPKKYRHHLNALHLVAQKGLYALQTNAREIFLASVETYTQVLEKWGEACGEKLVSQEHKDIARMVASLNGVYKPSGAGGGDLGLAFGITPAYIEMLESLLTQNGFKRMALCWAKSGLRLWSKK